MKCKDCAFCYESDDRDIKRCNITDEIIYEDKVNPEYWQTVFRLEAKDIERKQAIRIMSRTKIKEYIPSIDRCNDDCNCDDKRVAELVKQLEGYEMKKKVRGC